MFLTLKKNIWHDIVCKGFGSTKILVGFFNDGAGKKPTSRHNSAGISESGAVRQRWTYPFSQKDI